ncbi:hypothetical protein B0H12DRAFT_226911 [Mycena haematopus]|nr:hypothetical protein B0H12DRAFT_226911 [Mycena haematopus]
MESMDPKSLNPNFPLLPVLLARSPMLRTAVEPHAVANRKNFINLLGSDLLLGSDDLERDFCEHPQNPASVAPGSQVTVGLLMVNPHPAGNPKISPLAAPDGDLRKKKRPHTSSYSSPPGYRWFYRTTRFHLRPSFYIPCPCDTHETFDDSPTPWVDSSSWVWATTGGVSLELAPHSAADHYRECLSRLVTFTFCLHAVLSICFWMDNYHKAHGSALKYLRQRLLLWWTPRLHIGGPPGSNKKSYYSNGRPVILPHDYYIFIPLHLAVMPVLVFDEVDNLQ